MPPPVFLAVTVPALIGYLLGGLPFGYLFVRLMLGKDVRTMGSGNIGATNVQRTVGTKAGVAVLLLDVLKGFAAIWLASLYAPNNALALGAAMVGVVLGHCYPVALKFKGGKAVACFIGATLYIAPLVLAATALIFLVIVVWTGYVSLGSIVGAILFPAALWWSIHPAGPILVACAFSAALIVYRHRANIHRLRTGTENRFSFRSGSKG